MLIGFPEIMCRQGSQWYSDGCESSDNDTYRFPKCLIFLGKLMVVCFFFKPQVQQSQTTHQRTRSNRNDEEVLTTLNWQEQQQPRASNSNNMQELLETTRLRFRPWHFCTPEPSRTPSVYGELSEDHQPGSTNANHCSWVTVTWATLKKPGLSRCIKVEYRLKRIVKRFGSPE